MLKHKNKYLEIPSAQIDLHGLTKEEARIALGDFLTEAERRKYKKIRIITGKGLHSASGRGILNEYIKKILDDKGLKYRDAKINEGGEGAVDVEIF